MVVAVVVHSEWFYSILFVYNPFVVLLALLSSLLIVSVLLLLLRSLHYHQWRLISSYQWVYVPSSLSICPILSDTSWSLSLAKHPKTHLRNNGPIPSRGGWSQRTKCNSTGRWIPVSHHWSWSSSLWSSLIHLLLGQKGTITHRYFPPNKLYHLWR